MRMPTFVVASGLVLCLAPVWGPASADTDAKGFVPPGRFITTEPRTRK
jgi:hypothetical protein